MSKSERRELPKFDEGGFNKKLKDAKGGFKGHWHIAAPEGMESWRPDEGDSLIRVMPAVDKDEFFAFEIFVHYNIGSDNSSHLCLKKNQKLIGGDGRCPICEEMSRLENAGDVDDEFIKELRPKKRYLMQIIDRDAEDKGVMVYDSPPTVGDAILDCCRSKKKNSAPINITDPDNGYDVYISRKGTTKMNTKYTAEKDHDQGKITIGSDDFIDDCLDQIIPFKDMLNPSSYEDMSLDAGLGGGSDNAEPSKGKSESEDTSQEEAPPRRRRGSEESSEEKPKEETPDREKELASEISGEDEPTEEAPRRRRAR